MMRLSRASIIFATSLLSILYSSSTELEQPVIDIGTQKQLFVDDFIIASKHRTFRIFNQPVKYQASPIIELKPPQSVGGDQLVIVSGSVIYDSQEQLLKMWYEAADYNWTNDPVCYATSRDGIHWDLPKLGLYEHGGSKANNIVFRPERRAGDTSPAVFKDPIAKDPQQKYKMLYKRGRQSTDGIGVAFSPDGIHWSSGPDRAVIAYSDSPNSALWDPQLGKYVAHTRSNSNRAITYGIRREVLQSESDDFLNWQAYGIIMQADEKDTPWNQQFYNMEWMPYENVYFGFISVYHVLPGMEPKITPGVPWLDKVDIQLALSRDGRNWNRTEYRQVFIPNGNSQEEFDSSMIYVMQHPVILNDEIWIYYVGFKGLHWATRRKEVQGGAVGLAKLRLDGFASLDAGEGAVTTKVFRMAGNRLVVNADASLGSVQVEILDPQGNPIEGFTKNEADSIQGDNVRHTASWKGRSDISALKDEPLVLRFYIDQSRLYSFTFKE